MTGYKDSMLEIDKMLQNLESKPYERMAKIEQDKLKLLQDSIKGNISSVIKIDVRMGQQSTEEDEATRRRNKFRQLLSKYSDKPLVFDEKAKQEG